MLIHIKPKYYDELLNECLSHQKLQGASIKNVGKKEKSITKNGLLYFFMRQKIKRLIFRFVLQQISLFLRHGKKSVFLFLSYCTTCC